MSTKSIEIRKREAEALRARIDRDLAAKAEDIREQVGCRRGERGGWEKGAGMWECCSSRGERGNGEGGREAGARWEEGG